jgi:hypothetical protein
MKRKNPQKTILLRWLLTLCVASMLSACGGGDNESSSTVKDVALDKIMAFAEDGSNAAPTIQDYIDVGVSGITSENLEALNAIVDDLELEDVDTTAEVVALTTQLGITIDPPDSPDADKLANWGFKWSDGSVWQ